MTLIQMQPSTSGSNDRRSIRFLCTATDDNDALDQLAVPGTLPSGAPPIYDGLPIVDGVIEPLSELDREWIPGDGVKRLYIAEAIYTLSSVAVISQPSGAAPIDVDKVTGVGVGESDDPDKNLYSFDVSVQDQLEYFPDDVVNQRIQTKAGDPAPGEPALTAIKPPGFGFDFENGFKGEMISRPVSTFTLDIRPANGVVTRTYEQKVEDFVGSVNNSIFRGRAAGEVRLVAARGESRNNEDWQFSFTFQVKKNRVNIDLGNNVTFAAVDGWDRIDTVPVWRTVDAGGGQLVTIQVPLEATVWRDFPRVDLKELII